VSGTDWQRRAACRDEDPELFFPTSPAAAAIWSARAVCRRCPVEGDCLRWALDTGQDHGVWGGMTEEERRDARAERTRSEESHV
jgi:WhiB family redox-sensing transcriptional regulator